MQRKPLAHALRSDQNSRLDLNKEIRGPKKIKKIIEYFENFQKTKPEGANSTTTKKPKIEGKPLSEEILKSPDTS